LRTALPNGAGGGHAIHAGHHQVHQHHVGLGLFAQAHGLLTTAGLTDQFQVIVGQQKGGQATAHNSMVVH